MTQRAFFNHTLTWKLHTPIPMWTMDADLREREINRSRVVAGRLIPTVCQESKLQKGCGESPIVKNKQGDPCCQEPDVKRKEEGAVERGQSYPPVLIVDCESLPISATPFLSSPTAHVKHCTNLTGFKRNTFHLTLIDKDSPILMQILMCFVEKKKFVHKWTYSSCLLVALVKFDVDDHVMIWPMWS